MNYEQIKELHDEYIDNVNGMTGLEFGYETQNGHMADRKQLIFNVRKKIRKKNWAGQAPTLHQGRLTDVQEAGIVQPRRRGQYTIQDVKTEWLNNIDRGWRGSGGPVVDSKNGLVMLTNRHVAPDVSSLIDTDDGPLGIVHKVAGPEDLLDAAGILLDDSTTKLSSQLGIGYREPQIGDVVWMNGGRSGKKRGIVVAKGISKINDEVLGPFRSYSFRIQDMNRDFFAQSGDSGSAIYSDDFGTPVCVGLLNGTNARYGVGVPINKILEHFKYKWGTVRSTSREMYKLDKSNAILRRKKK